MGLGTNPNGNNWKYALTNFGILFFVQIVFNLNDLMQNPGEWPTSWFLVKTVLASAVATLIFAGYNKVNAKKEP